jgi:hypothetical protein
MEAITEKYAIEHLKAAHQILHGERPWEVRVISKDGTVLTGIFDHGKPLTFWINELDGDDIKSWYWSYNALKPEIAVTNKLERGFATGDSHYESRTFFYIDPEKAGDMATDEEVAAATATKDEVLAYLADNGFATSCRAASSTTTVT